MTKIIERYQEQKNSNVESLLGNTTIKIVVNNILAQTTKQELAQYFSAALFILMTTSLLKAIDMGFLKKCPGLIYGLITDHLEKSINTTTGHLHMRQQGL